ncbi:MAG: hypothetical protein AAGF96_03235 [Bacteroidota bacterium]
MKNVLICSILILFISCSEQKTLSPSETATTVLESLHSKDDSSLKKHTTEDGFQSLQMIQGYIPTDTDATFSILNESIEGDTCWVQYNTSYDEKLGVLKLIKADGQWKVTNKGPRERGPF